MSQYDDEHGDYEISYYGKSNGSLVLHPPRYWKIVPEGEPITTPFREFTLEGRWGPPRLKYAGLPDTAQVHGAVRAFAVPTGEYPL